MEVGQARITLSSLLLTVFDLQLSVDFQGSRTLLEFQKHSSTPLQTNAIIPALLKAVQTLLETAVRRLPLQKLVFPIDSLFDTRHVLLLLYCLSSLALQLPLELRNIVFCLIQLIDLKLQLSPLPGYTVRLHSSLLIGLEYPNLASLIDHNDTLRQSFYSLCLTTLKAYGFVFHSQWTPNPISNNTFEVQSASKQQIESIGVEEGVQKLFKDGWLKEVEGEVRVEACFNMVAATVANIQSLCLSEIREIKQEVGITLNGTEGNLKASLYCGLLSLYVLQIYESGKKDKSRAMQLLFASVADYFQELNRVGRCQASQVLLLAQSLCLFQTEAALRPLWTVVSRLYADDSSLMRQIQCLLTAVRSFEHAPKLLPPQRQTLLTLTEEKAIQGLPCQLLRCLLYVLLSEKEQLFPVFQVQPLTTDLYERLNTASRNLLLRQLQEYPYRTNSIHAFLKVNEPWSSFGSSSASQELFRLGLSRIDFGPLSQVLIGFQMPLLAIALLEIIKEEIESWLPEREEAKKEIVMKKEETIASWLEYLCIRFLAECEKTPSTSILLEAVTCSGLLEPGVRRGELWIPYNLVIARLSKGKLLNLLYGVNWIEVFNSHFGYIKNYDVLTTLHRHLFTTEDPPQEWTYPQSHYTIKKKEFEWLCEEWCKKEGNNQMHSEAKARRLGLLSLRYYCRSRLESRELG